MPISLSRTVGFLFVMPVALAVSACAPRMDMVTTPPSYETVLTPPIGETAEAQVGDTLFTMRHAISSPAIQFRSACAFSEKFDRPGTGTVEYKVDSGAVFTRDNISNGVPGYCGTASQLTPPFGSVPIHHCVAINGENLVPFPKSERIVQSDCRVDVTQVSVDAQDNFKRELLYNGKSGTTIRLSYREFVRDLARPAFTQDLSYDIGTDRIIGFKGARFEVIDASNTAIHYKVLSGF